METAPAFALALATLVTLPLIAITFWWRSTCKAAVLASRARGGRGGGTGTREVKLLEDVTIS